MIHNSNVFCVFIFLVLEFVISGFSSQTLRLIPRFTSVPPSVSYFVESSSSGNSQLDLICRVWPPNANLVLVGREPAAECAPNNQSSCPSLRLHPVSQDLGQQRFAILAASKLSSASAIPELIVHESLSDAIRTRPAANPNDEVSLKLSVRTRSALERLQSLHLHCLASTPFGQVLSPPFRVIAATLGDFPRSIKPSQDPTHTIEYCTNNIAAIECRLPSGGHPRPLVSFELNNTLISESSLQSDKYRVVWRPDGQSVSLLIHGVQFGDWGIYRCSVTNPLTGEKKYSPDSTLIKLISPTSPVQPTITVPLAPPAESTRSGALDRSQKIVVHEGQNVTLFCIIQGAPPPTVATYPFAPNATDYNRFQTDRKFGLLQITNVQPRDAGFYICSNRHISSTAQLYVKPRLRLSTKPEDVQLARLGGSAQFSCSSSESSVTPVWFFNGAQLKTTNNAAAKGANLDLNNLTVSDLGLYQCVAIRSSNTNNNNNNISDEWVSASVILSLKTDRIIRAADELSEFIPQTSRMDESSLTEVTTNELTPQAHMLYDNLAASVFWKPLILDMQMQGHTVEYRLEYAVQISPGEESSSKDSTFDPATLSALVGLVGYPAIRWSEPTALKQQTIMTFSYVTESILRPSKRYRFRVLAINASTGVNLVPPSGWSNVISTEHISPVEPPQIKTVRPLSEGRVHLVWTFDEAAHSPANSRLLASDNAPLVPVVNPLLKSGFELFTPDYFLVLARPLVKPKADSVEPFEYGAYWTTQFNGSSAREGILTGLNKTASYQVVVFAVRGEGDKRQITRFSRAAYVNLAAASHVRDFSLWRAFTTNRFMYLILGAIAAVMFLVVFIFILMCICRQQRERRASSERKKQNGHVQNYKDKSNYLPVSTTGCGPQHPGAGTISNHGASAATPLLMMSNLQGSAFSEHHGQQPISNAMLNDQYSAAMINELMLQQHHHQQQQHQQSMLGSQMHLQQDPQAAFQPQHHQSNHSLLVSPAGAMLASGNPALYQSGTLPGGPPRGYVRQQFGSQQPLNRSNTPGTVMEVPEFYQPNVYAHHKSQLPPVPHPQNAELPNGAQMHPQMVYYPGPMTPGATSLKREPPTGGPLQDGSAYGTLLQRGQLTGSMINDRSSVMSGSMRPMSGHHPGMVYYHPQGSQQALQHMMHNSTGMSTPQAAVMYSPRQQQQQQALFMAQQQFPGYFVQHMQQHPEAVAQMSHGHNDGGESIYSYFSQQEMGREGASHQPLNPLPEENQMRAANNSGFVESGIQTAEGQCPDGSPAGPAGSHRHHRRRRRKQPRQSSDTALNGAGDNEPNDSTYPDDEGTPQQQQGDSQLNDRRQMFEPDYSVQKRNQAGISNNSYGNAPGQDNFTSSQLYHAHQNGQTMDGPNRSAQIRYDSPNHGHQSSGQLPPPNQPPPPPPPPGMTNGFPPQHAELHHPGGSYPTADSLSRRLYSGPAPGGLLVGPPPRMRDYSEYGIPRGIGLPPTPSGGQPLPSHHNALLGSGSMSPAPQSNINMMYTGRYREGQA